MGDTTSISSYGALMSPREPPNILSTYLPPHENDRKHITGIHIMPTYGEVASGACPHLPAADPKSWRLSGASGRYDRQFRILREESVGQVRDACREVLQAVLGPGLEAYRRQRTSTHFDVCDDAKYCIRMDKKHELELIVAWEQPEETKHLTDRQRRDWWERCNRFRHGTLVSVLDHAGYILHFVVSDSTLRHPADLGHIPSAGRRNLSLSGDRKRAYISLNLVEPSQVVDVLSWWDDTQRRLCFLDFPDVTPASFKYTLEALQRDSQSTPALVRSLSPDTPMHPSLARYAQTPGFAFKLDCLMHDGQSLEFSPMYGPSISEASVLADLELAQAMVLLGALSREVALISGFPGCGKSYLARKIIKVLLYNRDNANLGPIIFIFHNDAALDKGVSQLLDDGIESIVRMGGSSTSPRLQNLCLPATCYTSLGWQEKQVEERLKRSLDELVPDIQAHLKGRRCLDVCGLIRACKLVCAEIRRIHDNPRREFLQGADVVAVTTTELARCHELLQPIQAKVIVCDDATDFPESHILTAILPSTEQIILIGNHTVASARLSHINLEGSPNSTEISFFKRLLISAPCDPLRLSHVRRPPSVDESSLPCGRSLPDCAHSCQLPRHGDSECGPCERPCDVHCSHGRCEKLCHEACIPCAEDHCASGCPHSQCTMPCAAPCNWVPCSRRCALLLDCGHQCPSLCGEACPESKYCQTCASEEDLLLTPMMSIWGMKDYRDINLDEDPCIFPRCGHFQTRLSMDEQLRMRDFYNLEDDGLPSSIKAASQRPFTMQKAPCCTRCHSPLRDICRYGRVIRGPMIEEYVKEFLAWRSGKFFELAHRLTQCMPASNQHMAYRGLPNTALFHHNTIPIELKGKMRHQMNILKDVVEEGRYADLIILFDAIHDFSFKTLKPKEQVFQKLVGFRGLADENNNSTVYSAGADRRIEPLFRLCGNEYAMDLLLRCNIVVLDDFLRLWSRDPAASTSPLLRRTIHLDLASNFRATRQFISQARAASLHMVTAQGHVYFAWYCGFALALGSDASTRERQAGPGLGAPSEFPISEVELERSAKEHLAEADGLYNRYLHASRRLRDAIDATREFVQSGNLGSLRVARTLWYTNLTGVFDGNGPLYFCDNGHPLMDVRQRSRFLGQLRCQGCGIPVAGRENAAEEEKPLDAAAVPPPQDEILVEI